MKYTQDITEARHFDEREKAVEAANLHEVFCRDLPRYHGTRVETDYHSGGFVVQVLEESSSTSFIPVGYLTK